MTFRYKLSDFFCTEGAPATLGNRSELVSRIKNEILEGEATSCIFHCKALVSITLLVTLKNTMDFWAKTVNYIQERDLNHRF